MTFFRLGLTGYPLRHSLSPPLHMAALQAARLVGEYQLYPVLPFPEGQVELQALLIRLRQGELHGLNVTIPHKSAILPWLDELTPIARAVRAVNTLYMIGNRLIGDNTDVGGFMADLRSFFNSLGRDLPAHGTRPQSALVLGAGGSARGVVYALKQAGFLIWIAARRIEQAHELAVGTGSVKAIPLTTTDLQQLPIEISLIVNTTPVGMAPHTGASAWPVEALFPPNACIYDLVYNPPETALVRLARKSGLAARSGLGMLIEQAALAFERWTGAPAARIDMQAAVADFN